MLNVYNHFVGHWVQRSQSGFGLTAIVISTSGIRETSLEFETHLAHVGGEIVEHWVQRSPCVSRHGLTASRCTNS